MNFRLKILNDFLHIGSLCVLVKIYNQSLFIICVIIPPNSPLTVYEDHINDVETLFNKVKKNRSSTINRRL